MKASPRSLFALVAGLAMFGMVTFVLAPSERGIEPEDALRPALTKLATGDEFPSIHTSPIQYGTDGPVAPINGLTRETWGKWASEAWPKACRRIESRLVKGRLQKNRNCISEDISGIDAIQTMRSTGFLEVDGYKVPVVWKWSRFAETERGSCQYDPAPAGPSEYLLTRSSDSSNWQLAPRADNHGVPGVMQQDGIWETCRDLNSFLHE
jgi:hypothetical protein